MKGRIFLPLLFVLSAAMHFTYFSRELTGFHVWRQTQTQSTILNFYEEDMQILNPRKNDRGSGDGIFRMEFPLMQWLVAALYKVFGNHLIITRICMFVISLFSAAGMYRLVMLLFNNRQSASIAAWALTFSPCFFYYAVNPLPDNLALCFAIWGLVYTFLWMQHQQQWFLLFVSGLWLSLGTLCKLPFVLYYATPAVYILTLLFQKHITLKQSTKLWLILFSFILLPLLWYVWVIPHWHHTEIDGGIMNNTESWLTILDYLQGNLISVLPELLLNYGALPLFIAGFYFLYRNQSFRHPYFLALFALSCSVLLYFLFEINLIGVMHDYYLFPFLPLLFIIVGYGSLQLLKKRNPNVNRIVYGLCMILPITCFLRVSSRWSEKSVGFNKDLLTYKTELRSIVPKDALCITGNDESHFIHFYFIDKKGWAIHKGQLNTETITQYRREGALYLYYDGTNLDAVSDQLDSLILERGSIKVYKLKQP